MDVALRFPVRQSAGPGRPESDLTRVPSLQRRRYVAIADAFDAMSSNRTYRSARSREFVREELRRCSGTQFDPELVEPFLAIDMREFDRMIHEHRDLHTGAREAA